MAILVVAATELEVPLLLQHRRITRDMEVLITGVGMVATAASCARALARTHFDLAFNFGVCGSFDPAIRPGTVVHVTSDCLSELGVEDGDRFIPMSELGFGSQGQLVNTLPPTNAVLAQLPAVRAITVNTVHGHERSIASVVERLQPQVESMEGAAFAYACNISGVPYAQVRAVSNAVERRNRDAWRLDLAIRRLNETATELLDSI